MGAVDPSKPVCPVNVQGPVSKVCSVQLSARPLDQIKAFVGYEY